VWVGNASGARISEFSSAGAPISTSSGYTGGGLNTPDLLAIDTSGNVWAANYASSAGSVSEFSNTGTAITGSSGYTGGGLDYPFGIAIDPSGNVWAADASEGATIVAELSPSGTAISGSGFTGGGLDGPWGLAIDGSGNVWAANFNATSGHSVSELNSSGTPISPSTGYQAGGLAAKAGVNPQWLAIDGSGNVWVTNGTEANIAELVGAATPVVTPMVANLKSPYGSHAVNRP
jgi:streptogramin lyase